VLAAEPNAGHRALAEWSRSTDLTLVTQNVDDLHERAGSTDVRHLHGSLVAPRCTDCARPAPPEPPPVEPVERLTPPRCEHCGGAVRPGVVWFGEVPHGIDAAADAVVAADLLVVVGTSGVVYPAAGLTDLAVELGRRVLLVDPAAASRDGVTSWPTTAATGLPALVAALG
jgi:NAD-dependent deacetylase